MKHKTNKHIIFFILIQWLTIMLCQFKFDASNWCLTAKSVSGCLLLLVCPCTQLQSSNSGFSCTLALFFYILYCVRYMLTLAFKTWAICESHVLLALWLMNTLVRSALSNKCSSFHAGRAFIIEPERQIALNDEKIASDKASCQSPRWYITACVFWAGDDIYHKKAPLNNTVESLK